MAELRPDRKKPKTPEVKWPWGRALGRKESAKNRGSEDRSKKTNQNEMDMKREKGSGRQRLVTEGKKTQYLRILTERDNSRKFPESKQEWISALKAKVVQNVQF